MKIPDSSIALVVGVNENQNKVLGTAFCFLKSNWFVTAKHVVEDEYELLRDKLTLNINGISKTISEIMLHKNRDIALLVLT